MDFEVENKSIFKDSNEVGKKWVEILELNRKKVYQLAWNDKYLDYVKIKMVNRVVEGKSMNNEILIMG